VRQANCESTRQIALSSARGLLVDITADRFGLPEAILRPLGDGDEFLVRHACRQRSWTRETELRVDKLAAERTQEADT
jgi:hypothetical protein